MKMGKRNEPGITPIIGKMVKYLICQAAPFMTTIGLVAVSIFVDDGQIIVGGWASSSSQAQVAAVWIDRIILFRG